MDTERRAALAGCVAADSLDDGSVRTGPPELLVMMNGAEDRVRWKGQHEIAAGEVFQQGLNESLQMRCFIDQKLDWRGVAAAGKHFRLDSRAFEEIGKPGFAAKVQLKGPVTQRHDPGDAG